MSMKSRRQPIACRDMYTHGGQLPQAFVDEGFATPNGGLAPPDLDDLEISHLQREAQPRRNGLMALALQAGAASRGGGSGHQQQQQVEDVQSAGTSAGSAASARYAGVTDDDDDDDDGPVEARPISRHRRHPSSDHNSAEGGADRYTAAQQRSLRRARHDRIRTRNIVSQLQHRKFQRGKLLGRGASGVVYQVVLHDGSFLAMKQLDVMNTSLEEGVALTKELRMMATLKHPNIVRYYHASYIKDAKVVALYMEYVHGGSLGSLARRIQDSGFDASTFGAVAASPSPPATASRR
jgi:hypothetical protein